MQKFNYNNLDKSDLVFMLRCMLKAIDFENLNKEDLIILIGKLKTIGLNMDEVLSQVQEKVGKITPKPLS
jgi:hypothetical protein